MKEDERRHKRFFIEGMEIGGRMMFAADVRILNISLSGVSLMADRRLELGTEYTLKLVSGERSVAVKGVVVWATMVGSKPGPKGDLVPVYTTGLKFTNVIGPPLEEILSFIDRSKKDKELRLTGIRFHIVDPGRAILNFPENYRVKKISKGGMLIESIHELDVEGRYPMELHLPEEALLRFMGRVASCQGMDQDAPVRFDVGIEFLEMADEDKGKLSEFIHTLGDNERLDEKALDN